MARLRTLAQRTSVATRGWLRDIRPERRHLRTDAIAAVPNSVSGVPDGMASAALVGVSPVYGLYANIFGPLIGGLFTSTRMMIVTTTTAGALAASSALSHVDSAERPQALFLLTLIVGVLMIVAGVLRLGRYVRFVSHSVMTGFLTGVAVNILLGQLADLSGADVDGATSVAKAADLATHPGRVDFASLVVGLTTLVILFGLARTRLVAVSALLALVVPTTVVAVFGLDNVAQVRDSGDIPRSLPLPALPDPGLFSFELITGAVAVAVIVLVQGAGVNESAPNPDGSSDINRDFTAQGIANVTVGIFRGQPVGGSVSRTALNVAVGPRTRWSAILSGAILLPIVVLFSGLVGLVPLPTLAAVLVFAAVKSLSPSGVVTIWRTGATSEIALVTTFVATLLLPVAAAVGIGVALSLLLQLNQEAMDLKVVELVQDDDGRFIEQPAPAELPSEKVTLLDVYGSLLYAGSRTLQAHLPDPTHAQRAAVILRLRGRVSLGATFYRVIGAYSKQLARSGSRLYLSGLDPQLVKQLRRAGGVDLAGPVRAVPATPVLGASTRRAQALADSWLIRHRNHDDAKPPAEPDA
ncbi:SulP family inorganic anion transporter [Phytoactinopolyspora endophytica]|uniref:SulP family inorganic anion transporter n=1 Tax=Phytoactinopolyspora endophytica TaxID=1642495 RepID=UPI00101DD9F6|nr:SulP family inorganic anion transporter [Phytoactinopolyspora endophytica]